MFWWHDTGFTCSFSFQRFDAVDSATEHQLVVDISSDLSLDHHVCRICAGCYRLRQLRRLRRSLDSRLIGYTRSFTPYWIHGLITATLLFLLVHQGQSRTSYSARRHRHLEVWPLSGLVTAQWTSLARRPRPGVFQAGSDSSSLSERPRTAVPVGLLCSGRRCRHSAASAFRQPSVTGSTSLPAQHLRPSGLFSCWPYSLELFPGLHPGPDHQCRLFQTFALNLPVRLILHCVSKKRPTFNLSLTLSNLNRFSKFLHCWKAYEICYKSHMTIPTLP